MKHWNISTLGVWGGLAVWLTTGAAALRAGETTTESQLRALEQQNEALQGQVRQQRDLIENLSREVAEIRKANEKRDAALDEMKDHGSEPDQAAPGAGLQLGRVRISGEGSVGFFKSGSQGLYPNSEFRVNEAKLFFEAPVWGDVYTLAEVNLASFETEDVNLDLGELYLDFEDVSKLWGRERQLSVRAGRMDIPFGEEYIRRDAIDNPLVSRSLSDIWGVDEGVELYGSLGKFSYVTAVQNGGVPTSRDFDGDKAISGRLSYDPARWLHLSASAMRTGDLDAQQDYLSELWFGNWWLQSLGSPATTKFHAHLVEGDFILRFPHGHLSGFGGWIYYDDNDPGVNNARDVYYFSVEAMHELPRKFYAAARYSQIFAAEGFIIVGNGNMNLYSVPPLTTGLWRLSMGLGYRWSRNLALKVEYSLEQGKQVGGLTRHHENLFATEAAFAF